MSITIGTCGNCGGRVSVPEMWGATVPPVPTCEACGARQRQSHGPVIDMERPAKQFRECLSDGTSRTRSASEGDKK